MKIVDISPKEDFLLRIVADDGSTGLFDVKPYLNAEAFLSLKDHTEFQRIHNSGYFIEWNCGADLSADTVLIHFQREHTTAA